MADCQLNCVTVVKSGKPSRAREDMFSGSDEDKKVMVV